jgi:GNAT superfamily N-acetyltransferase
MVTVEHRRGLGAPPLELPEPARDLDEDVALRALRDTDVNFIYASWTNVHRGGRGFERMETHAYFDYVRSLIRDILARRGAQMVIACDPERPDIIRGWLCFERAHVPVLHYLLVKREHQRRGIGRALVAASRATGDCIYTFSHRRADRFVAATLPGGVYIPIAKYLKP